MGVLTRQRQPSRNGAEKSLQRLLVPFVQLVVAFLGLLIIDLVLSKIATALRLDNVQMDFDDSMGLLMVFIAFGLLPLAMSFGAHQRRKAEDQRQKAEADQKRKAEADRKRKAEADRERKAEQV